MVAVGLELLGLEDFLNGKYWTGELYVDLKKEAYKKLGFKRLGFFGAFSSILGKIGRLAMGRAKEKNIKGDMKGDGFQNGGTIIVGAGGKDVLLKFIQEHPAEHVSTDVILKTLGIDAPASSEPAKSQPEVQCNEDVCEIKK